MEGLRGWAETNPIAVEQGLTRWPFPGQIAWSICQLWDQEGGSLACVAVVGHQGGTATRGRAGCLMVVLGLSRLCCAMLDLPLAADAGAWFRFVSFPDGAVEAVWLRV